MPLRHNLLAFAITTIWGLTFVSIKMSLLVMPPFALSAWRFLLAAIPLIFFVGRPQGGVFWLMGYALFIALGQFAVMFVAMQMGMPAGLMSLIIQTQVFFTIALAVLLFKEAVSRGQLLGCLFAMIGLVVIGVNKVQGGLVVSFLMVLFAAFSWAAGNTIAKQVARHQKIDAMNFVAWTSLFGALMLIVISLCVEPVVALLLPLTSPDAVLWLNLIIMAYAAHVFGMGLWSNLLTRYPASAVSPFALWVPVAGMTATAITFGERLSAVQLSGALLVMMGLAVTVLWPSVVRRLKGAG